MVMMATSDKVTGVVRIEASFNASRSNPQGLDVYQSKYEGNFVNTETVGDTSLFTGRVAFKDTIPVTSGGGTLSLADSVDPMGSFGSNVPSADPEGGVLKVIVLKNLSPTDGTGQTIYVNDGHATSALGLVVDYSAIPSLVRVTNGALPIYPGGVLVMCAPLGLTSAMNDGVDDELQAKTATGSAQMEILILIA